MNWKRCLAGVGALLFASSAEAQTNFTPVFQFAVFYNSLLEFTLCPPFTFNGPTHANANIYTGSLDPLTFNGLVTTTGTISSPAWDSEQPSDYTAAVNYNAGYSTNCQALTLSIGTTNYASILSQSTNSSSLYYNAANLVLLVSNSTISLTLQSSSADPQPTNITACYYPTNSSPTNYVQVATNFPFLTITNTFTDQRENNELVKVTDINVGVLSEWLTTNKAATAKFPTTAGVYAISNVPNVLYVADNRTYSPGQLTAVRLKNGATIPYNPVIITGSPNPSGFTVATPNPLYVWGNYNCPNPAYAGTTNTTTVFPASLVSDALTILSPNWVDSQSSIPLGSFGKNAATSDTVNAAILTGSVPSTGPAMTQYSGGIMNLPRLLENWGNGGAVTLTLNTSLVNLFASSRATNQWQTPGVYYYAPTRQFSFCQNFLNSFQLPPGTPLLGPTCPVITVPPQSQTVSAGQTAMFNVGATGYPPLSYQWQFNGTNIPNATNITWTNSTLTITMTITNASASNAGLYSVVVTDGFGNQTSFNAALTVNIPPAISLEPQNLAVLAGQNAAFTVSATGTEPLFYQWQFYRQFNGINLAGETNATLQLSNATADQVGWYVVTVTNMAGMVTSTPARLMVYTTAAAVLNVPSSSTGGQFQFSITGVPGFNYAIEASTNMVDWMPLATNMSPFTFVDGDATNFPARYYRSVYLP